MNAYWYTVPEVALLTGYSEAHVRRLCAAAVLPATRLHPTGNWKLRAEALDKLMAT